MSKIGKKNIVVPKESSIKIEGSSLTITGPKGTKKLPINDKIFSSKINESEFKIEPVEKKIDKIRAENKPKSVKKQPVVKETKAVKSAGNATTKKKKDATTNATAVKKEAKKKST